MTFTITPGMRVRAVTCTHPDTRARHYCAASRCGTVVGEPGKSSDTPLRATVVWDDGTRHKPVVRVLVPETIAGEDGPQCLCGNYARSLGFYPINEHGEDVEPDPGVWKSLLRCNGDLPDGTECGLVIDQDGFDPAARTFPVVGRILSGRAALTR